MSFSANQLIGFYMRGALVINGLMNKKPYVSITSQTKLYKELRRKDLKGVSL